jgi:hypothetical protein
VLIHYRQTSSKLWRESTTCTTQQYRPYADAERTESHDTWNVVDFGLNGRMRGEAKLIQTWTWKDETDSPNRTRTIKKIWLQLSGTRPQTERGGIQVQMEYSVAIRLLSIVTSQIRRGAFVTRTSFNAILAYGVAESCTPAAEHERSGKPTSVLFDECSQLRLSH